MLVSMCSKLTSLVEVSPERLGSTHFRADMPSVPPSRLGYAQKCAPHLSVVILNIGPIRFALGHVITSFFGTNP
jgi:hypothetical protein